VESEIAPCTIEDDVGEILEKIRDADEIIMASPVHCGFVTGLMTTFVERIAFRLCRPTVGFFVVLLFAFIMGYGATLAEPALNALGLKVEEITVGTFKKSLLMQAVASGVGLGMLLGVVKIIWNVPLVYLLIPPYLLLLIITKISTEEFVNIAWDSAGVTTGPITVPLVLAIGLGIGNQVNVVEGFGILSLASVCPILAVLTVGLYVNKKRKAIRQESA